jgi:hypothetical protein
VDPRLGGFVCKPCDTGYQCIDGITSVSCPSGTYADEIGTIRCLPCPEHAICGFNYDKGTRDRFECRPGYSRTDVLEELTPGVLVRRKWCRAGETAPSIKETDDSESLTMVGVVAGCVVVIAFATALYCSKKQKAYHAEMTAFTASRHYEPGSTQRDQSLDSVRVVSRNDADYSETRI